MDSLLHPALKLLHFLLLLIPFLHRLRELGLEKSTAMLDGGLLLGQLGVSLPDGLSFPRHLLYPPL